MEEDESGESAYISWEQEAFDDFSVFHFMVVSAGSGSDDSFSLQFDGEEFYSARLADLELGEMYEVTVPQEFMERATLGTIWTANLNAYDEVDASVFIPQTVVFDDPPDEDLDGIIDDTDNCPSVANASQSDFDEDGIGDACDDDIDGDGVPSMSDLCPATALGAVVDASGCSDEQLDSDNDGINNGEDNCPDDVNPGQEDQDGNGIGDACDVPASTDEDNDGVADSIDVCPATAIPEAVPSRRLGRYRWTLDSADGSFTQRNRGKWSHFDFTTADTRGCSCDQIIEASKLPRWAKRINRQRGCSTLVMLHWIRNP